jgi:hypothetical protein
MGWTELRMKSIGGTAAAGVSAVRVGDVRERVLVERLKGGEASPFAG